MGHYPEPPDDLLHRLDRYRVLAENSDVGMLNTTLEFEILYANPTILKWFGLSSMDELRRTPLEGCFTEAGWKRVLENREKRKEGQPSSYETEIRSSNGSVMSVLVSGAPVVDASGRVESIIATFVDITEMKRTLALLKTTVEAVTDGILVVEESGAVLAVNRNFVDLWKVPAEVLALRNHDRLIEHVLSQLAVPENFTRFRNEFFNLRETPSVPFELKDGRWVEICRRSEPLPPSGQVRIISVREITERKRVEERLMHADRMSVMGALAAGVAHEINNPLTHLICGLELLEKKIAKLDDKGDSKQSIAALVRSASRIGDIVKELKSFSRSNSEAIEVIDIQRAVESTLPLLASEIKQKAFLKTDFQPTPPVFINEGRLSQVLLNLMVNALQAMRSEKRSTNHLRLTTRTDPRGWAIIEISDTGVGIPKDMRRKIFEPFFTTKPVGMGTGLGLSICHTIVKRYEGEIDVESTEGAGSLFRVSLPPASVGSMPKLRPEPLLPSLRSQSILIIDDEPSVCETLIEGLGDRHRMGSCANGAEALAVLRSGAQFDVILCDLMMPVMDGMELYETLKKEGPWLIEKFVFMTGGALTEASRQFIDSVPQPVLHKPFSFDQLRKIIDA